MLIQKFGIVLRQLAQQNLIIFGYIVTIGWHHKEQNRVTLDVAQETRTESLALVCTLDDTWYIGHYERLVVTHFDNTQIRLKRRKGIVGNLGLGSRHNRQQCTLTCIGETYKTNIGQHLQLQNKGSFVTILTWLCIARRLIRSTLEVPITKTTTATLQ